MTTLDTHIREPRSCSPTAALLDELQLYGHRPFKDEPDPRPLPEPEALQAALTDIFDAMIVALGDTRLEPDLENLLWSTVNVFHRATTRIECDLDGNEQTQKRSQREQDGSEIRSVELERLTAEGLTMIEHRNAYEHMRDLAADLFEAHLGQTWRPHSGSLASRRTLTSALIDSRDFIVARRRADTETLLPAGTKIAFAGGADCNDHRAIWAALDRVHAKHPDMVLMHGATPKGAEKIASCWADSRKVPQIAFKPDWNRHGKAAPFKRNDQLLDVLPIGLIVFPGSGITDNLADKARKLASVARRRMRGSDGGYRRDHLRALAQCVEVSEREVRIMGSKNTLLRVLAASNGVESAANDVRIYVPEWRAVRDKNANYLLAIALR